MTQANRFKENPDEIILKKWKLGKYAGLTYKEYRNIYMRMNEAIRHVASANNILLIDLAKEVPQSNIYMYDPVHLTDKGSEYVAKLIANQLREMLVNTQEKKAEYSQK